MPSALSAIRDADAGELLHLPAPDSGWVQVGADEVDGHLLDTDDLALHLDLMFGDQLDLEEAMEADALAEPDIKIKQTRKRTRTAGCRSAAAPSDPAPALEPAAPSHPDPAEPNNTRAVKLVFNKSQDSLCLACWVCGDSIH